MSYTVFLLMMAGAWLAIGLIVSYLMARRGHSLFSWWVLGAVFGPLVLGLAVDAVRRERTARERTVHAGVPGEGPIDVLVGIDGSAESEASLASVVGLLGPRIGRLTLVAVVDYDAALDERSLDSERKALADLERAAGSARGFAPETVLLAGPPAAKLAEYALRGGYELLAVGPRGRGASKPLLGSVASHLARGANVPVLIAGGGLQTRAAVPGPRLVAGGR